MFGKVEGIKICGIASSVPDKIVDNIEYVEKMENRRVKKQIKLTGVERRRVCREGQKAGDLASVAAEQLFEELNWRRDEIDVLIFVTQSEELVRPSTAFIIQNRLGLKKECLVYDINMGCSGFVAGMTTLAGLLSITKSKGLLMVGESNAVEQGEFLSASSLLEGDAAATIAVKYDGTSSFFFHHYSDGSRANLLYKPWNRPGYMDGNAVLLFGIEDVTTVVNSFLAEADMTLDDIDYFVFHQAQKLIVDGVADVLGIGSDRVLMSCKDYGNTSSASIPLTLCAHKEVFENGTKKVLMCGFGIGLSCGCIILDVDSSILYSIIETDKVYDDKNFFV